MPPPFQLEICCLRLAPHIPMDREEAIARARHAAEARGLVLAEPVSADPLRFWPSPRFWRVSFQSEETGLIIVVVREHKETMTVLRLRPWSDYSVERVTLLLLALAGLAIVTPILSMRALTQLGLPIERFGLQGLLVGGSFTCVFLITHLLRFSGKDRWFLRPDLRRPLNRT